MLCINDVINSRWEGDGWGYIKTNSIFFVLEVSLIPGPVFPKQREAVCFRGLLHFPCGEGGISAIFVALCPKCDMVAMFM